MKRIKYLFYTRIDKKVVYLQTLLNKYYFTEQQLLDEFGCGVIKLDVSNNDHIKAWCDVINHSYDDCYFDSESAIKYLTSHLFLQDTETFLIFDMQKTNTELMTKSVWGGNCLYFSRLL